MALLARIRPLPRRASLFAALVALSASAVAGVAAPSALAAKKKKPLAPVITSVQPHDVAVGENLTIRGRNFIRGRSKNTVVFKRDGARAVFAKADIGTTRLLTLKVPGSLQEFFSLNAGNPVPTRFRVRVLAHKFGKKFTSNKLSPIVSPPRAAKIVVPTLGTPDGDCDGDGTKNKSDDDDDNDGLGDQVELSLSLDPCQADSDGDGLLDKWEFDCDRNGVLNRDQADDDSDLLDDTTETSIGTDPCSGDTDGDGVEDGFEYQSARDLNDDEYGSPNEIAPFPGKRPYPNPLYNDKDVDYDGDSLTLAEEQALWQYTYTSNHTSTRTLSPLSYSDGTQYTLFSRTGSNGRRVPSQPFATYPPRQQFVDWATSHGYMQTYLSAGKTFDTPVFAVNGFYDIRDVNLDHTVDAAELNWSDFDQNGYVGDAERDEDADGLANYDELHGRLVPGYWNGCYSVEKGYLVGYAGTNPVDADSDGDGVLDGADDQDHDDVPNIMERSRIDASSGEDDREAGQDCKVPAALLAPTDVNGDGQPDQVVSIHPNVYGRVNPFNPCLPFKDSRTCPRFVPFGGVTYAPFDFSPDWLALQ
jgi:hypothetical protein